VGIGTTTPGRQLELAGTADAYIQLTRNNTGVQATLGFNTGATNDWLIRTDDASSNLKFYSYGTSNYPLILSRSTGAATFSSTLSVNGASGGNSITVSQGILIGDGYGLNAGNFQVGAITNNRFYIYNNTLSIDNISINPSTGVTTFARAISGTSATFSSTGLFQGASLTVGSAVAATNVKLLLNGVASKAAGIEFQQSGTAQWYIGNGIASEDNNFELYNSNGTMAMKIIKSTNAINFIGATTFTSSASSVINVISTSTDSRINMGHSGNGGFIGYANLGSGAAANTFYITTGAGTTTSGIRMNNDGNVTVAGTITESSSIRYKENIETLKYGLDKVVQLRGVTYNKKDTGVKEIGLIAEEVESILPDVILRNQEGEPDSVSYGRITAVLIEAIKELKIEIEELKRR
jgi:hypothetical protein